MYPIMLKLAGRACVVVGGGRVAARKVRGLLEAEAQITVISPDVCAELKPLIDGERVRLVSAQYHPGIISALRPTLVFTATDDEQANQDAADEAHACGALVNRADAGDEGDFENMVVFRRGGITGALSTGGASPLLARQLSEHLQTSIGSEYVKLVEWMAAARPIVRRSIPTQEGRSDVWREMLNSPILDELRQGNLDEARLLFDQIVNRAVGQTS